MNRIHVSTRRLRSEVENDCGPSLFDPAKQTLTELNNRDKTYVTLTIAEG